MYISEDSNPKPACVDVCACVRVCACACGCSKAEPVELVDPEEVREIDVSSVRVRRVFGWPLHDIVITNSVWCIAYTREIEGESYTSQCSCISCAPGWAMQVGVGGCKDGWFVHMSLEVKQYLVKAKLGLYKILL